VIYEVVEAPAPIRQGDIFREVPRVELPPLREIPLVRGEAIERSSWREIADSKAGRVSCIAAIRSVVAIVLTQDCDAVRAAEICLCEIGPFAQVERMAKSASTPKAIVSIVTKHARVNQKWFYLPIDPLFGFNERMAVDFQSPLSVLRPDLEEMRATHRVGRLTKVAREHYRERAAEFFRRYPYDEWYPLNRDELAAYRIEKPEPIEPYPWQR